MNNLSKNPAFMKRMENAVEFKSIDSVETKTNYWLIAVQILAAIGGAYCIYKLTEPRIVINHYYPTKQSGGVIQQSAESKNNNQNTVV